MVFDLSLFTPFLTLISLIIIYPYYRKKERNYFILLAIVGFCYDLFYTNLLFTHAIFFPFIGYLMSKLYQKFSVNGLTNLLLLATSLFLYQVLFCFFLLLFNIVPINWYNVLY